ncbi:MAG: N-acetylmuramoyl-L-alanine amidase, partial [Clostridia bacterium]|nr:N-acetylmuramoyl-L-alanine amidase [Clostridia bacterium]
MFKKVLCLILAVIMCFAAYCERDGAEVTSGGEMSALPLYGLKIGIDPGHQLNGDSRKEPVSPGSSETKARVAAGTRGVSTGRPEHEVDLEIALKLRDLLTEMGAQVLMTRETADVNISNVERAEMMNLWGADCVLRIHCDGSTDHDVHGMAMYVRLTGEKAQESCELAQCLLSAMGEATGAKKRGVFKRDTYSGLNWSKVPAVLVECGYMSNPEEDKLLSTPEYQEKLVLGMAMGLAEYFGRADDAE